MLIFSDVNVGFFTFQSLQETLDAGSSLPSPDGVLINGQSHSTFTGDQGYFWNLSILFRQVLRFPFSLKFVKQPNIFSCKYFR